MERWHDLLTAQVAERPEAAAFSDSGGTAWSYAELSTAVEAVAEHLRKVGVQPRDRVMVLSENCCAAVAAMLGASRIGAIAVPVNARMSAGEVDRILSHARPAAVLCTSAISPEAEAHAARIEAREISGAFGALHLACPYASNPDAPEEVAVLLYTTGTTGAPKGVMLTHANLLFGGKSSAELRDMGPGDVIYGVLPMTHVFGLASVMTDRKSTRLNSSHANESRMPSSA